MRLPILRIVELVRPVGVWSLRGELSRFVVVVVRVGEGHDRELFDASAQSRQILDFFFGLVVGHENVALKAERVANVNETDPGVSSRAFDYDWRRRVFSFQMGDFV